MFSQPHPIMYSTSPLMLYREHPFQKNLKELIFKDLHNIRSPRSGYCTDKLYKCLSVFATLVWIVPFCVNSLSVAANLIFKKCIWSMWTTLPIIARFVMIQLCVLQPDICFRVGGGASDNEPGRGPAGQEGGARGSAPKEGSPPLHF